MLCPVCYGKGQIRQYNSYNNGCKWDWPTECPECKGYGFVYCCDKPSDGGYYSYIGDEGDGESD